LRAVFLLLDVDALGERPLTNRILQFTWPPAVTGESALRFWWRNLVAIQFDAWQDALGRFLGHELPRHANDQGGVNSRSAVRTAIVDAILPQASAQPATPDSAALPLKRVRDRRYFSEHLAMLQKFVALCQQHDVALTVAFSPLRVENASTYDAADLAQAVEDVSRIAPVWDFGSPQWLSKRTELWFDPSHFAPEVGHLMLDRIFLAKSPPMHEGFGVLRRSQQQ
jgi:hypothetical protein